MIDTISSFLWMREGSDQIALLRGEGFCNPRGIWPTVPSWVIMDGCYGQCSQNYSHCVLSTWSNEESQRNRVFQNKVYTLVSRQLQLSVTASFRLYNFTTFKRKRPSTKIRNAFKIAEIYHSCLSRAILKITWFSLKKNKKWKTCSGITSHTKVQLILRCLL